MSAKLHRKAFNYTKRLIGDKGIMHWRAVLSAKSRTGQYKRLDVENADAYSHAMIDRMRDELRAEI